MSGERESFESCYQCGALTGRAGKGEDSIYCDGCGELGWPNGPYCEDCWRRHTGAGAEHPATPTPSEEKPSDGSYTKPYAGGTEEKPSEWEALLDEAERIVRNFYEAVSRDLDDTPQGCDSRKGYLEDQAALGRVLTILRHDLRAMKGPRT